MSMMTVQQLLSWAFVHELPKGGGEEGISGRGSAWSLINGYSVLGTKVQMSMTNDWRPEFILEQGDPHPDAMTVGRAVTNLLNYDVVIPDGWSPITDWVSDEAKALARPIVESVADRMRGQRRDIRGAAVQALVVSYAALNRMPVFSCEEPRTRFCSRNGQRPSWFVLRRVEGATGQVHEVEVDGFDRRNHRPRPGAYRKTELSDDPRPGIMARLDWQLWVSALRHIEDFLSATGLESKQIRPMALDAQPWGGEDGFPAGLFPDR